MRSQPATQPARHFGRRSDIPPNGLMPQLRGINPA
jgi:hypothetical protein